MQLRQKPHGLFFGSPCMFNNNNNNSGGGGGGSVSSSSSSSCSSSRNSGCSSTKIATVVNFCCNKQETPLKIRRTTLCPKTTETINR